MSFNGSNSTNITESPSHTNVTLTTLVTPDSTTHTPFYLTFPFLAGAGAGVGVIILCSIACTVWVFSRRRGENVEAAPVAVVRQAVPVPTPVPVKCPVPVRVPVRVPVAVPVAAPAPVPLPFRIAPPAAPRMIPPAPRLIGYNEPTFASSASGTYMDDDVSSVYSDAYSDTSSVYSAVPAPVARRPMYY